MLQRLIADAVLKGSAKVTIPPGTYHLRSRAADAEASLYFKGLKNVEIVMTGATFLCGDRVTGWARFDDCDGVTLRGGTVRHDPTPSSQGSVTAIGKDRLTVDVRIAAGYPADLSDASYYFASGSGWLDLFDPATREWKRGADDLDFASFEPVSEGVYRFTLKEALRAGYPIAVGDPVAWRGNIAPDLFLQNDRKMRLEGMTFQSASGFCVSEYAGEGGNFYRYTVERGPAPTGATEIPLLASNADAFHSNSVRKGPTLEGCAFSHMDDDGVPIHGGQTLVMGGGGSSVVLAVRQGDAAFGIAGRPGDVLHFYDEAGALGAEGTIASVGKLSGYTPRQPIPAPFSTFQDAADIVYLNITLTAPPARPPRLGWLAINGSAAGGGYVVRKCAIRNNRARGMLLNAPDGLVEECLVEGTTMAGIALAPEMESWPQSDYSRNVTLRNNTIRDVCVAGQNGWFEAGALTIAEWRKGRYAPLPGGHRNIAVEGNTFENIDGPNVVVASAQGVAFRGNRFVNPMRHPSDRGKYVGVPEKALYWITESDGVTVQDNVVLNSGPFLDAKALVQGSPTGKFEVKP
ncbi:Right handed beta helix region [Verrucomicrobium sp. GAS474]|nr:Right handed beta helix region [Verrucomicrobium sp. GAS474]